MLIDFKICLALLFMLGAVIKISIIIYSIVVYGNIDCSSYPFRYIDRVSSTILYLKLQ